MQCLGAGDLDKGQRPDFSVAPALDDAGGNVEMGEFILRLRQQFVAVSNEQIIPIRDLALDASGGEYGLTGAGRRNDEDSSLAAGNSALDLGDDADLIF